MQRIQSATVLQAVRENIEMITSDGLRLVGELALPEGRKPRATLVTLHPLPTAGGYMDSHLLLKASRRLPELADLAVLRFNTRGTSSPRGTSDGMFGDGITERADVAAAMAFVAERDLPSPWLVGWSFGTELALKYGLEHPIAGAILLSPPLRRTSDAELRHWRNAEPELVALIPEHDDFLQPVEAAERFAAVPRTRLVPVEGARHLWVGENQTRRVLTEILTSVAPDALPLVTEVSADRIAHA
jgi:alpha/beta superfamily hydrolase